MISFEEAVLVAIARGAGTVEAVSDALGVSRSDVEKVLEKLMAEGLVRVEEKGWWIFKWRALVLTRRGFEAAVKAHEKLAELASRLRERLARARGESAEALALAPAYLFPLMLWMGLLDLALLDILTAEAGYAQSIDQPDVSYA